MINVPYSVYYATKFEKKIWSSLREQNEVESVSKSKYNTAVLITMAIEPLKSIAGAIEGLVRCPISLVLNFASFTGRKSGLDQILPLKVKTTFVYVQNRIQSPKQNMIYLIDHLAKAIFYTALLPFLCYCHWNANNIEGLYIDFNRKLGKMEDSYIPLSEIYCKLSSHKQNK